MSIFTTNYENTFEKKLLPEGQYGAIIKSVKIKTTTSGAEGIEVMFNIPSQRQNIWKTIWKTKATKQFSEGSIKYINSICNACHVPVGTSFSSFDEMFTWWVNQSVNIMIGIELNSTSGAEENVVKFVNKTNKSVLNTQNQSQEETPDFLNDSVDIDISDDDLPF